MRDKKKLSKKHQHIFTLSYLSLFKCQVTMSWKSLNLILVRLGNHTDLRTDSGALRDLVQFVQFKKRERHPWRSVNFRKVASY